MKGLISYLLALFVSPYDSDSAPDSPSLGQERYRRGHNPNHYGIHSPKSTCSAPEADDYGFQGEIDPGRPGIRSDRYWAYKAAGNRGSDRHKEYDKARGSMHHGRKKDGPEFVGDPHLRRSDHHTLAGIAGPLLDARLQEQEGRRSFNNDFIGHFEHKQSWQGHRDKVNNVTNSVTKAERFVKSHNV